MCASEVADNEDEIQIERKKKMAEIVQNIGIKVNKRASQKRNSIIDKLKDKIETSLDASEEREEGMEVEPPRPEEEIDPLLLPEQPAEDLNENEEKSENASRLLPETAIEEGEGEKNVEDEDQAVSENAEDSKLALKIKDPLACIDETSKG